MVNLLKYRDTADYCDGRETDLIGNEAYALYAKAASPCLAQVGGTVSFAGEVRRLMMGEVEGLRDDVVIANCPRRSAMLQMMRLPDISEIGRHRVAGLADQLNIKTVEDNAFHG